MTFHSVYLQRRQPGVSYRDFQRLWRSHGDFAAQNAAFWPHVRRYIHNDPLEDATGLPAHTAHYDAVGELFYTDYATWLSLRDVMLHEIAPDEARVFNGPSTAVRGDRTIHLPASGLFKLFTFAQFDPALDDAACTRQLAEHAQLVLHADGFGTWLSGFTTTRARASDDSTGMNARPQTRSNMDIVFIHHFDSEAAARAALASSGYAQVLLSEAGFLQRETRIAVMTHGWVLKGNADGREEPAGRESTGFALPKAIVPT